MDCIVHGVAKSQTRLSDFHFHLDTCFHQAWKNVRKKTPPSTNALKQVLEKEFKRGQTTRGQSPQVSFTLFCYFFLNHMKSLHTLKSYRKANQNYNEESPLTGQNDLCQKVHKQ